MPLVEISNAKGLVQKTGEGLVAVPVTQSLANTLTIDTSCFYTQVDPDGAHRAARLEVGLEKGQLLLISNVADAAENITFNGDDFTAGAVALEPNESILCVWNGTKWSPTSQSLS